MCVASLNPCSSRKLNSELWTPKKSPRPRPLTLTLMTLTLSDSDLSSLISHALSSQLSALSSQLRLSAGNGSDRASHFGQWIGCHNWVLTFWLLCLFKIWYLWYNGVIQDIYALCWEIYIKKCILGSYGQEFGSKMRFRDSWVLGRPRDRCWLFWIWPRIRAALALLRACFRSKRAKQEVYELDPPLLGPQPRILGRSIWALATF